MSCLQDKKQPGRPPGISGKQRACITALAFSDAPGGHGCWTLQLLADKIVELQYCEQLSHVHVGRILKNDIKLHMKVSWFMAKVYAVFLAQIEDVIGLYAQPYDASYPVVCYDERPSFLIADTIAPVPIQTGKIAKEHYSYYKNGSCCLLAAIEPLKD